MDTELKGNGRAVTADPAAGSGAAPDTVPDVAPDTALLPEVLGLAMTPGSAGRLRRLLGGDTGAALDPFADPSSPFPEAAKRKAKDEEEEEAEDEDGGDDEEDEADDEEEEEEDDLDEDEDFDDEDDDEDEDDIRGPTGRRSGPVRLGRAPARPRRSRAAPLFRLDSQNTPRFNSGRFGGGVAAGAARRSRNGR